MTENKQSTSPQNQNIRQAALVGQNIGANNFLFLILGIYLVITTGTWQAWGVIALAAEAVIGGFVSASLMKSGRVRFGAWVLLLTDVFAPALAAWIIADFSFVSIAYIAVSTYFIYTYAMPREERRSALVAIFLALLIPVTAAFADVTWKLASPAMLTIAPILTSVLGVAFLAVIAREAWSRNNIRSRFLTITLGLTLIAAVVIAVISVTSLFSAGQHAQEASSQVLREQAQETLGHQTAETALRNDLILQSISQDARDIAQQAANIFENPNAFNTESFWKADDHMFFGPDGQYINGEGDVSTVFIPNTVEIDDNIKQELELLAYLDMALVPVYEGDPNSVAIYFVGSQEISWLYPNINLGAIVPPDYLATQDIFYSIGSPANNPERQVVWTPVYDDPGGQGLLVSAIAPVYANGKFMGVIGIDVSLAGLTANIESEDFGSGDGAYAFLLDPEGRALALPTQGYKDFLGREPQAGEFGINLAASAREEFSPLVDELLAGTTGFQSVFVDDQEIFVSYTTLNSTDWRIASVVSAEQILAPAATLQTELEESSSVLVFQRILPVGLAIAVVVVLAGLFFTNRLANPIEQLTEGAAKIGKGEWDTPLPQSDLVEISGLSGALSTMSTQLKGMLGTLEQRVADRTRNLELAAEVGRAVSQVRDLDVMLKDACDLILKEFNLYYVQVYLTDPSGSTLKLEAGTGSVGSELLGRGHSLVLNANSINGRAAVEKHSVVISDTTKSASFRQNPLLPETRGEMAVPLIVANKVVGVLDMQSSEAGVLTDEVLPAFEALAGQLAVAIQNANLLEEVDQARLEVEKQAARLVRTNWQTYMDAIHKPESTGFVFNGQELAPLTDAEDMPMPEGDKAAFAPIEVLGEQIGSLVVEANESAQESVNVELVNAVARQVAQQIESLRLVESAERYRMEAESAARRLTTEGWKDYIQSRSDTLMGYMYDTNEVKALSALPEDAAVTLPIQVGEEIIGKVAVQDLQIQDDQSLDIAKAVVERLGAHIENLRLLEQSEESRAEFQESQERLSEALNIARLGNWEYDVEKDIFTFNDNFYAVFRTTVEAVGSYTLTSADYAQRFVHPEDAPLVGMEIGKTLSSTDRYYTTSIEHRMFFPDGSIGHMVVNVHVERDEQGNILRYYGANQDITERKLAEEELRAREAQLSAALEETQTLYRINEAITNKTELETIYQAVAQLSCDELDFSGSWIAVYEPEKEELKGVAGINMPEDRIFASLPLSQNTPGTLAAQTRQLVKVNDPQQDERMQDIPQDVRAIMGKSIATPVMVGQELLGVIAATRSEDAADISAREERMLQSIATQLAIVMQRLKLFDQIQKQAKREAMLNVINQKIQSATSVEAVLQIAARELGTALGAPMTVAQLSMKDATS